MAADADNWIGQLLDGGRYRVDAQLRARGMALGDRAPDRRLNRDVVIKVPHAAKLRDPAFAERFEREVRALVELEHPHIVKVIDVGRHRGYPYAVLQFLPGGSLRDRLREGPDGDPLPMPPEGLRGWLWRRWRPPSTTSTPRSTCT